MIEKYANLVRKYAHKYSRIWNVDNYYDEVESEGWLIYCKCLQKFDPEQSCKFSTYLSYFLQTLGHYCEKLSKIKSKDIIKTDYFDFDEFEKDYSDNVLVDDFLAEAEKSLNADSYNILKFILSFQWVGYVQKPTKQFIADSLHLSYSRVCYLYRELKSFWKSNEYLLLQ